ncbi:MAG: hypothetical protein GY847_07365 [Proteobacteria bacterium]|nr:hypothetical protein [Pseudomonadota bacterium]
MKRNCKFEIVCMIAYALIIVGCMDRKPAPICPVPTELSQHNDLLTGFDGVDLLVVVDNSASMEEEQQVLATGFFTLINSLVEPITNQDWPYPAVSNIRVAVVTSDMGLQYGEDRSIEGFPYGDKALSTCETARGDDGIFWTKMSDSVEIESGVISCEQEGDQCPTGDWDCVDGKCVSSSGQRHPVDCPKLDSHEDWAETEEENKNASITTQVACQGMRGTKGCGVEQQLEATVRALSRKDQKSFLDEDHLLAVLIVSDEEDCSIADKGLFETEEWLSGPSKLLNTACNLPTDNEKDYLFNTNRYRDKLITIKNSQPRGVIFAAIIGVPNSEDAQCQGKGHELGDCLEHEDMQLEIVSVEPSSNHFVPACERKEGDLVVTSARPGRRYVQVAESFGANGYVYSICNSDWSPAMKDIAKVIVENVGSQCYSKKLEWSLLSPEEQGQEECENCGEARCNVVVTFQYDQGDEEDCPPEFEVESADIEREYQSGGHGEADKVLVHCPLPKLPAPIDCELAEKRYKESDNQNRVGWYYCENHREDYIGACKDGYDNDGDQEIDCMDSECQHCPNCGGSGIGCDSSCQYGLELTAAAKKATQGNMISVQCLQQFSFEDKNCQENSLDSCTDDKDNDGNGIWDCDKIEEGSGAHFPDTHCCPMTKSKDNKCKIDPITFVNCPGTSQEKLPDACIEHAELLSCDLPRN